MRPDNYYLELEKQGYYETIDKRSKDYREYKEWKASKRSEDYNKLKQNVESQSKGVGDTVAKITKATGVDKLVKFIAGEDCGCDERQVKLNKLFTYKKINCISEDDYTYLSDFVDSNTNKITNQQKVRLITIHNNIFNTNQKTNTSCSPCISGVVNKLKKYLQVYK
jgi:tyrosine-protein phosphatase YwqE